MFGMQDGLITLAWFLSFGSAVLCIVYGAIKWNKGGEDK